MTVTPRAGPTPGGTFAAPPDECDIVMKGGVTSGIVYPPVVLKLAPRYRFRSVGGTSAGAIAAALTAAAEFGRERGGFDKLAALNTWLGQDRHLLELFQPSPATRPLLRLMLAAQRRLAPRAPRPGMRARRAWLPAWLHTWFVAVPGVARDALPARYWIATVIGGVIGGTVDVLLARGIVPAGHPVARTVVALVLPVAFVGGYLGSLTACGARLWRLLVHVVPAQDFGICDGRTAPGADALALTDWLHAHIQELAGLPHDASPLTVGMLSGKSVNGVDAGITLRMVTTSLSLGRPFVLPIADARLLFREDDMRRLLPGHVVDALCAAARRVPGADPAPAGFDVLPPPDDMPVLLMARMSLSFPVLLSAVPLYAEDAAGGAPRRVWFSDGGITSNFPIHFFDAWLPSRPTFGINLASLTPGAPAVRDPVRGVAAVSLPAADRGEPDVPSDIATLPAFLAAIWTTAQNFRDNTLAALPGYRERIVQIRLTGDEGGLHLTMDADAIAAIVAKGDAAGDALQQFDFDQHRWVRMLTFMAQFERNLLHMGDTLQRRRYAALVRDVAGPDLPWPRDAAWRAEALARLTQIEALVAALDARAPAAAGEPAGAFFDVDPPRPEGVLRVTPRA